MDEDISSHAFLLSTIGFSKRVEVAAVLSCMVSFYFASIFFLIMYVRVARAIDFVDMINKKKGGRGLSLT